MNIIEAKNITKEYVNGHLVTKVLRGVDVTVKKGEWVAIMGKSGAGKSTLMYQLSLLDMPTAGSLFIENFDVLKMSDTERTDFRLRELGYVFQDYALIQELSAIENVMVPLIMRGVSTGEAENVAIKTLEKIGLGHRLQNRPNQLSGGEQQRVSVARATAQKPKILFADEPTANLDNFSSEGVIEIMRDIHRTGQTIIMVTHEKEYTKYCDRILYLDDGKIVKEETKKK